MEQSIRSVLVKQTLTQQQQFASLQVWHTHAHTPPQACVTGSRSASAPSDGLSDRGLWRRALSPAVGA